eukprot:TRINITY_DN40713_c0_g1_i1.p1 TRINITY_DN40713_c0_g1~~TRINITY_DN40713_c0_g1_i1.p1  ORF type:complete len:556 (+),score=52.57 TRINITY_DN40713_c0_g1_i1:116-1783(+)
MLSPIPVPGSGDRDPAEPVLQDPGLDAETLSEFLHDYVARPARPRTAWLASGAEAAESTPQRCVARLLDVMFAEELMSALLNNLALHCMVVLVPCCLLILLANIPSLEGLYSMTYWTLVLMVAVAFSWEVDRISWGESPRVWLYSFLVLSVVAGVSFGSTGVSEHGVDVPADSYGECIAQRPSELVMSWALLHPAARLLTAGLRRDKLMAARAFWQVQGVWLGALPYFGACCITYISRSTDILNKPLFAATMIVAWSNFAVPLRSLGKLIWSRLSPRQSLLLTVNWVAYTQLATSCLGLVVWRQQPTWALLHVFGFAVLSTTNVIRGRMFIWTQSDAGAVMQRLTVHSEVLASMLGRLFSYLMLLACVPLRYAASRSSSLNRLAIYDYADADDSWAVMWIAPTGILLSWCIFISYLFVLPWAWCPASALVVSRNVVVMDDVATTGRVKDDVVLAQGSADEEDEVVSSPAMSPEGSSKTNTTTSRSSRPTNSPWSAGRREEEVTREQNRVMSVYLSGSWRFLALGAAFVFVQASLMKNSMGKHDYWLETGLCRGWD